MSHKLVVIGIDSLDPEVLRKYKNQLPHFSRLMDTSPCFQLNSIFPVDSIPAWISIYTGLNPAKHGVVKTYDIFDKSQGDILKIGTSSFQGRTFWDYIGAAGKKVCIVYPFLAYPPWEVNGIMLSKSVSERKAQGAWPWSTETELKSYPSWVMERYNLPPFMGGVFGRHPGPKNLFRWANDAKQALINETNMGIKICQDNDWDLFFIYFSWLDIVQHRLWRYFDINDPSFPGKTPLEGIILEFYQLVDSIIGNFLDLCPNIPFMVLSDHGHGIRPTKTVNINKVLKDNDMYYANPKKSRCLRYIMEKMKGLILDISNRYELDYWLVDLSTKTQALSGLSKDIYMSTSSANKEDYMACLSAFAGVKSYSHGGIEIQQHSLSSEVEYEDFRTKITDCLLELRDPKSGERLVEWVCKREDLYPASTISDIYPDVVFQLKEEYGTGWSIYTDLVGKAYDHNLASGGHKKEAVFLISGIDREPRRTCMTLMDVAPNILDIMGIKIDREFDGKSVFT